MSNMENISKRIQGISANSQIKKDELRLRSKERLEKLNESYKFREQIRLALENAGNNLFPILLEKDTWESLKGGKNGIAQNLYDLGDMIIKVGKSGVKIVANKHSKDDIHSQMGERAKKLQGAIYELKTSVAKLTPQKAKELNEKYALNLSFKAYQKLSSMEGFEGVTDPNLSFREKTLENANHIAANVEHIPKAILNEARKLYQSNDPKEWGEAIGYNLATIVTMLPIPGGLGKGISSLGLKTTTSLEKIGKTGTEISNLLKTPLKFSKLKKFPQVAGIKEKEEALDRLKKIEERLDKLTPERETKEIPTTPKDIGEKIPPDNPSTTKKAKPIIDDDAVKQKQREFEDGLFNAIPFRGRETITVKPNGELKPKSNLDEALNRPKKSVSTDAIPSEKVDKGIVTRRSDGVVVTKYSNRVVAEHPDGDIVTRYFDGDIITKYQYHNGTTIIRYRDGRVVSKYSNGDVITTNPNDPKRAEYMP